MTARFLARAAFGGCALALVAIAMSLEAHDLFLKPSAFFIAPNSELRVAVLNGTFQKSEAAVTRERLRALTLAGPSGLSQPPFTAWDTAGKESLWRVTVGGPGTYVIGASVLPRTIRLEGEEFNSYLKEDGLPDVLAERRERNELAQPAHERYSKHVKAVVRAGRVSSTSGDTAFRAVFGYPAELVPLNNPYALRSGRTLRVRALVDGEAVANQVILAGGVMNDGRRIVERSVRSDTLGDARIAIRAPGLWYVKFIRMRRIPAGTADSVDYESKWATLTFAVR
ncbi:MAG: DUF4198 domain-containing protein [Gemmatimonadales bacterium]